MKSRALYVASAGLLAIGLTVGRAALATPASGVVVSDRIVSSIADIESSIIVEGDSGQLQLHQKIGSDKAPVNVGSGTQTFAPGAFSGWHSHSGPGWVVIVSGTATNEQPEGCFTSYPAGSVIFEAGPADVHNLRNLSATDTMVLRTWFFLPVGVPSRIDQQPLSGACN
jgi:quercetin dioxygenase-like cupin family protein